jgi:hypothetical protein
MRVANRANSSSALKVNAAHITELRNGIKHFLDCGGKAAALCALSESMKKWSVLG